MLTTPRLERASDVVRALGAVQAQDYAGAKWALAQRTSGATDNEIERELTEGRIIRTHVLRPTWHFVAPADLRWMLALTAPRVNQALAYYNRKLELTPAVFKKSHSAIGRALRGGKHLTRLELKEVLERAGLRAVTGQRLGHLMAQAELDAVICSGARRGKQFTYALVEERVPPAATLTRDEALHELSRRYFTTRGPATVHDFAWWSGLTIADVRRAIAIAGDALRRTDSEGRTFWSAADAPAPPKARRSVHLLPNYDEYFIGYKDRSAIGGRIRSTKPVTGGNALIAHVIAVNGELVGGWKRIPDKGQVVVEADLVVRLTAPEQAGLGAAARRFGEFLGSPAELRIRRPRRLS